eukprot:g9437.t1
MGGCCASAAFAGFLHLTGYNEKLASWWYLGVAISSSFLGIGLISYPYAFAETSAAGSATTSTAGSALFVDRGHYQFEVVVFSLIWMIMMSVCVVDSLLYMPVDIYRVLCKNEVIPSYFYQVYYHHVLGLLGMVPMLFAFERVGGFSLSADGFAAVQSATMSGAARGTMKPTPQPPSEADVAHVLQCMWFCNRFVYLAEFSTIFLHARNLLRLYATESGKPTPAAIRTGAGVLFAISFAVCRVAPTAAGLWHSVRALREGDHHGAESVVGGEAKISKLIACCYLGFTLLNGYWASEIVKGLKKAFCGGQGKKKAVKGTEGGKDE